MEEVLICLYQIVEMPTIIEVDMIKGLSDFFSENRSRALIKEVD